MKLVLRQNLPLEVWADINEFLRSNRNRRKVAELVNQSGDTEFTEIFMKLLHEVGKITLREMSFLKSPKDNTACLGTFASADPWSYDTPIAQTQMPDNIKNFKCIHILHFDAQALDFCRKLRILFSNDVNLSVWCDKQDILNNFAVILNHLAPLIGGIRSFWIAASAAENFLEWAINEPAFQAAFAQTKILSLNHIWAKDTLVNFLPQWLTMDQAENEPKMAYISLMEYWEEKADQVYEAISLAIKRDFLAATVPSTFFVFCSCRANEFQVENESTGELLTVKYSWNRGTEIWRHKIGAEAELGAWIDANINLIYYDGDKLIRLDGYREGPTLGSFDEPQDENAVAIADGEKVNGEDGEEGKA